MLALKPKLVLLAPVVFACIELLPTTVFVEILPPPLPMLIVFTEISPATNNWLLRETSPSRDNAPCTVTSPPIVKLSFTYKSRLNETSPPAAIEPVLVIVYVFVIFSVISITWTFVFSVDNVPEGLPELVNLGNIFM